MVALQDRGPQRCRRVLGRLPSMALLATTATSASAASFSGASLTLAWILPFVGILASIALLPSLLPDLWHRHFGKIALAWAAAFVIPFTASFGADETLRQLVHAALREYLPFVILLFALYTVSGGIGLFGKLHGTPLTNLAILAIGAVLANLLGTTGAAMVLVRPLIRANQQRGHNVHVLVFFIFIVANAGGALTPIGDPPLFLGFLNGVSFFWTTGAMLAPTLTLCGALLAIFHLVDRHLYVKHGDERLFRAVEGKSPPRLRIAGVGNVVLLMAIVGVVLLSGFWRSKTTYDVLGTPVALQDVVRDLTLIFVALASLRITPRSIHETNGFQWAPIKEVAKLFAAIFVTILPVIAILEAGEDGSLASLTRLVTSSTGEPITPIFFWLTGLLSAFLDNAPTYLVFFHLAGGDAQELMTQRETLRAISAGAVYMGAYTYIGNAPNFMVRSIAENRGIRMPSFFGYLLWSCTILTPLLIAMTFLFFR